MRALREGVGYECGNVLEAVDRVLRENGIPELLVHLNVESCAYFAWQIHTRSSSIETEFE